MTGEESLAGIVPASAPVDRLSLWVAGFRFKLEARSAGLRLSLPAGHLKFMELQAAGPEPPSTPGELALRVRNEPLPVTKTRAVSLCQTDLWELWLDEGGNYIFMALEVTPPSWLVVDPAFTNGEVFGDFSSGNPAGLYPLQGLDNLLFVNWLASVGDTSLHASAVVMDGKGYAFIGQAGVGKSTLAASLASEHAALVLGEDQIALRFRDGRFWIHGTPWHENPAMCSPSGAPLEKLFFLVRDAPQGIERLAAADGITRILQNAFIPYYRRELVGRILDRLVLLSSQVPFYKLSYQLGNDAWKLIQAS